uniref:Uncharacterized protein n=1 Tax=Mustela putorius furo TaxID=9669 RepID=M3XYS0_MUSPF
MGPGNPKLRGKGEVCVPGSPKDIRPKDGGRLRLVCHPELKTMGKEKEDKSQEEEK